MIALWTSLRVDPFLQNVLDTTQRGAFEDPCAYQPQIILP
jgi:hypothetical protein